MTDIAFDIRVALARLAETRTACERCARLTDVPPHIVAEAHVSHLRWALSDVEELLRRAIDGSERLVPADEFARYRAEAVTLIPGEAA